MDDGTRANTNSASTGSSVDGGRIELIVNADDVGAHPFFTDAAVAALEAGAIGSATLIAPGPDADRALAILKDHPEYDIGVHLSLNGQWKPLLPPEQGPSLRNERGTMWATQSEVAGHVRPEEAKAEWDAQVRKVLDAGVRITHLDGHMGCYFLSPELFVAALEVAMKYRVPLIAPFIPEQMPPELHPLLPVASYTGIYRIEGKSESLANRTEAYRRLLSGLGPGTHYLFTHPGRPGPQGGGPEDMDLRINDFAFWTGEGSRAMLSEMGIRMVGGSSLGDRFRKALEANE